MKHHTPYSVKKIFIMQRVVDLHVISDVSEIYSMPWASQWMQIYKENIASETPILSLSLGTSHSIACTGRGKLYCWGWNDNGQCGRDPTQSDEVVVRQNSKVAQIRFDLPANLLEAGGGLKCKQILASGDSCMVLCSDTQEVLSWGGNERG